MNEDTGQETHPAGRTMIVMVAGDTVTELEMAALDEARKFFGADTRLAIVPDYQVAPASQAAGLRGAGYPEIAASGKRYYAHVPVRTVER